MQPAAYAIGILTFALWLSVLGIGGTGMAVTGRFGLPLAKEKSKEPFPDLDAVLLTDDFSGPEEISQEATDTGTTGDALEEEVPLAPEETLPEPPAMPETEDREPLPDVSSFSLPVQEKPKPALKPVPRKPAPTKPVSKTGGSSQGNADVRGAAGQGGRNGGSGMSDAKRLGGGRMPAPAYPTEARRKGQTGTVVVEFIVGENGSVVSAYATRASPWPLLNEAAVRAVRRWKFPASGKTSKYIRPITFKLN